MVTNFLTLNPPFDSSAYAPVLYKELIVNKQEQMLTLRYLNSVISFNRLLMHLTGCVAACQRAITYIQDYGKTREI